MCQNKCVGKDVSEGALIQPRVGTFQSDFMKPSGQIEDTMNQKLGYTLIQLLVADMGFPGSYYRILSQTQKASEYNFLKMMT